MLKMCFAKSLVSNNKLFQGHLFSWDTGNEDTEQEERNCTVWQKIIMAIVENEFDRKVLRGKRVYPSWYSKYCKSYF